MGYEVFKSFYAEEDAIEMLKWLTENGIHGKIEKSKPVNDKVIIGNSSDPFILLRINSTDFNKAHQVISDKVLESIGQLDPDYYLFGFSDEELLEIVQKPDEWNEQDFVIAQKILADRGISLSKNEVEKMQSERMSDLSKPETEGLGWIFFGYALCFVASIVGLFWGLFVVTGKKLLPDGNKVFVYNQKIRDHGAIIIILSSVMIAFAIAGFTSLWPVIGWFIFGF